MGLLHGNRKYNNKEQLEAMIEDYFLTITREVDTGVTNSKGESCKELEFIVKPSMFGLAMHCGIGLSTLEDYQRMEEFSVSIKRAVKMIEQYKVNNLDNKDKATAGIIFDLKNNHGYVDRIETDNKNENINHNNELKGKTSAEIAAMITELKNKTK